MVFILAMVMPTDFVNVNTLRQRQIGQHLADHISKCIFMNQNIPILFLRVTFCNIPSIVQVMAWNQPGDKPLFEPMILSLLAHICVTITGVNVDQVRLYIIMYHNCVVLITFWLKWQKLVVVCKKRTNLFMIHSIYSLLSVWIYIYIVVTLWVLRNLTKSH